MRSRTVERSLGLGLLAAAAFGCESTPQPVTPGESPTVNSAAAVPELGPAKEAGDIIAIVRWKNPSATLSTLAGCANVPTQVADGASRWLLELGFGDALRGEVDGKAMASLVALDAPIDGIVVLDPASKHAKPMSAFSIGLGSFDKAKAAVESVGPLTQVSPGVFKIGDKRRDLTCFLANSAGQTPARLVCGAREQDAAALAPYLARTMPTQPSGPTDLHGEFRFAPIDARFGQELRQAPRNLPLVAAAGKIGEPVFDKALDEAAAALADEVPAEMSDLDKVSLDLSADPGSCLTLDGAIQLRGHASWLAKTLTDRPERQGPAPAIFWRLPKDSDSAFYGHSADPARFTDVLRVGRGLLEGYMIHGGVPKADAKAVADLLAIVSPKDANTAQASGHVEVKIPTTPPKPQQAMEAMVNSYLGWYLVGVDDGGDAMAKWVSASVAAFNRAAVQKQLKFHLKDEAKHIPQIRVSPGPPQLGKGSLDVEIKVNEIDAPDFAVGAKRGDKVTFTGHILVMIDKKSSWVGFATNRDELVKRMVMVKEGAPDAVTLATRGGLEPLKNGKYMSAGYVTILPFTKAMATAVGLIAAGGMMPFSGEISRTLGNLPHKGESPVFVTTTVTGGDKARVDLAFNVGKGTIEDLGALVQTGLSIVSKVRGGGPMMPGPPGKP
jgi:hypothetical protein